MSKIKELAIDWWKEQRRKKKLDHCNNLYDIEDAYIAGYEEGSKRAMTNWIKASEDKPKVGRLVIVRSPSTSYDDEGELIESWEYDAGILKQGSYLYVNVAHEEYGHVLEANTEWQYVEE